MEATVRAGALLSIVSIVLAALPGGGCDVRIYPFRGAPTDAAADMDGALDGALPIPCPDELAGFATTNGATTGGSNPDGGATTMVLVNAQDSDALARFTSYASDKMPGPLVIQVSGMISLSGGSSSQIKVSSNKTVIGGDASSGFTGGGLDLTDSSNVILKNLVISKALDTDAITLHTSTHVWIDHCDLSSDLAAEAGTYDGLVDITHASDFVTISWTRFHDHDDTGIVGHSDSNAAEDTGTLHVTYHHDLFTHVTAGPRLRFGSVHLFNVYFEQVGYYAIASTMGALALVDDNYFKNIQAPAWPVTTTLKDAAAPGYVSLLNNATDATDGPDQLTTAAMPWTPPYPYLADSVTSVPALVAACAGTGKTSSAARD